MSWTPKEQRHTFDDQSIPGLHFLIGDLFAEPYHQEQLRAQKYPMIAFPSDLTREMIADPESGKPLITLFKSLTLPLQDPQSEIFLNLKRTAAAHGYEVRQVASSTLEAWEVNSGGRYRLSFDPATGQLLDVAYVAQEALRLKIPRPMELLDAHSRALLPKLYSTEPFGLDAIALVKFFTPDSGWTWYATEFDGTDLFFGLVAGFEVELGLFSLNELTLIRGPLGLPLERDLYFTPTSLKTLQEQHYRARGEL